MKKYLFLLVIFSVIGLGVTILSSCQIVAAPDSGYVLGVDGSKHLTKDVTYNSPGETDIYGKDGTYELDYFAWDNTSSKWVQGGGERGTYTWDPSTFVLTATITGSYSSSWNNLSSSISDVYTQTKAFTDHAFLDVFNYSNGVLSSTNNPYDEVVKSAGTVVYTYHPSFSVTLSGSTYKRDYKVTQLSGGVTTTHEEESAGNVTGTYPANAKLSVGNALTYLVRESSNTVTDQTGSAAPTVVTNVPGTGTYTITLITSKFASFPATALSRHLK